MESLNKNYAQYMFLKEGIKKKNSTEEKGAVDFVREDNQRACVNQINFSFFINEVKI
jgi:hypothetical protein